MKPESGLQRGEREPARVEGELGGVQQPLGQLVSGNVSFMSLYDQLTRDLMLII